MSISAHVKNLTSSATNIEIHDEQRGTKRVYRMKDKWQMKDAAPPKRWNLTIKEERIYLKILSTEEGRRALNEIKNDKTNAIINSSVEEITKDVVRKKQSKLTPLGKFLKELSETSLQGNNTISATNLGLTKKAIWGQFQRLGLVEKYSV